MNSIEGLNMNKAKENVLKFSTDRDWDQFHSPENLAKSIVIEASELLECFQWDHNFDHDKVVEELADVMNYCILLSDKLNVNIEKIILDKLKKNEEKYPVDKAKGTSKKYSDL